MEQVRSDAEDHFRSGIASQRPSQVELPQGLSASTSSCSSGVSASLELTVSTPAGRPLSSGRQDLTVSRTTLPG